MTGSAVNAEHPWDLPRWGALPEGEPGELVAGHLVEEEMPTRLHEAIVAWLMFELMGWARRHGARVYGSDLKLAVGKDRGRKPDISVYFENTRRSPATAAVQAFPPDLVVEVISASPEDARRDRIEKLADYSNAGIRLYWIVDPEQRSLEILERTRESSYRRTTLATKGVVRVPGVDDFDLDLDALWRDADSELAGGR